MPKQKPLLMIADSFHDADMFYATRFLAPDPFVCLRTSRKNTIFVSDLELSRAHQQAACDEVCAFSRYRARAQKRSGKPASFIDTVCEILREKKIPSIEVPAQFWHSHALGLQQRGIKLSVRKAPVFPARASKTKEEIKYILQTIRKTEKIIVQAVDLIRQTKIRKGYLYYEGNVLTSEQLRKYIQTMLCADDCEVEATIVSGGKHSANPHDIGAGPLRPHQPIVLDVFPRSSTTRYYADLTRTVVRGKAPDRLKKMYHAVICAQEYAFSQLRHGVNGRDIWQNVLTFFDCAGFATSTDGKTMKGFFHGVGHGVGLDIHEFPSIGAHGDVLKEGHVVTVEPGLYYPDIGGIRIEDMALITRNGAKKLSRIPAVFEV